jgi:hypothetical protein
LYVFPGSLAAPGYLAGVPKILSVWETAFHQFKEKGGKEKELQHHKLEEFLDSKQNR